MRNKAITADFYIKQLGFQEYGVASYAEYLMVQKDSIQLHFFLFDGLNPRENYGQIYIRTNQIDALYRDFLDRKVAIHPNGHLQNKQWGQKEFSILDPDSNLLTFGQGL